MRKRRTIGFRVEPDGVWQSLRGRDAWALLALAKAGMRGLTPLDTPEPRWSGYVFNLRQMGISIETLRENHGGPFAGTHARYVLRSQLLIVSEVGVAE